MADSPKANRLIHETSPYLLQHAHNPVDWYPWGPEAFDAARAANKPIFLSVGYSTCYWCHVMERQSFENAAIAQQMNEHFINIKVDREERPDVDQLYMNAVQAMSGHGGWPMSVFMTPDLRPFFGGTYFPPAAAHGRISFPQLLAGIDDAWKNRRNEIDASATRLVAILRQMAHPQQSRTEVRIDKEAIDELLDRSTSDYDPTDGGFGSAPKFPRQTLLELLLTAQRDLPNQRRMDQLLHTLDMMARGGIRDHLGGAFHRYSTDDRWLVPHFEIMLYDNAMLAWIYAEAFSQTKQPSYAAIAGDILDFILREMTSPAGAFYTAFDAEVDAQEGMPYLWTAEEVRQILRDDASAFEKVYGLSEGPNFADPHHGDGVPDKNILFLRAPLNETTDRMLEPMRQKLYAHRRTRKQPLLDTKILTSWNALMIRAMAHAGKILNQNQYIEAAEKAAEYLLRVHTAKDGSLHRVSRDGKAKGAAFLDDYAFLAQALLALHSATGQAKWHDQADILAGKMCGKFVDPRQGGFFFTAANANDLIVRQKTASDSPLPSGNAIAADVMMQLGHPTIARDAIAVFAGQLQRFGEGMSALVQSALTYVLENGPILVEGQSALAPAPDVLSMSAQWAAPDQLDLTVSIADGFHINAHQAGQGLTPTVLSVAGVGAEHVVAIDYPPAQIRTFPFADEPVAVYEGKVTVTVRFGTPATELPLTLHLRYQPCNENSCLAATTKTLVINSPPKGRA